MSGPELLPCPFCGGDGEFEKLALGALVIMCGDCQSTGPDGGTEAEAIAAWNTRPQAPAMQVDGLVARVEQMRQTIADNDPNEPIADNGMTVWDGIKPDAAYLFPRILAALRPSQGWQPIETAPKDGTYLLLRFAGPVADTESPLIAVGKAVDRESGWWVTAIWGASMAHESPTHWQPLPTPPEVYFRHDH